MSKSKLLSHYHRLRSRWWASLLLDGAVVQFIRSITSEVWVVDYELP
ncbi:MAG: hypothetical protein KAU50_01320 [Candidatus Marinimicrobia bacterium]|nr:hypothetical protein [Candidatus Neomarinimicrobiota bacterium]